jgi:hypothetical protein
MPTFFQRPALAGLAMLLISLFAAPASANTFTVTSAADTGAGTLRQAVIDAVAGDTIHFALAYPAVIFVLTSIPIGKNLTIAGPGPEQLALDGAAFDSVLSVTSGATLDISQLTVRNSGNSALYNSGTLTVSYVVFSANYSNVYGGAISNLGGLTVSNSRFDTNRANSRGGAIYNNAGAAVNRCSFTGNTATHDGGAIANYGSIGVTASTFSGNKSVGDFGGSGGAILNESTLVLKDSTLTGNATSGAGGAVFTRGSMTLSGSTISSNSAPANGGRGIFNYITVSVSRSIVDDTCAGAVPISTGDNIGGYNSCFVNSTDLHDRVNINPHLVPLADNGGPTQTQLLQANSPALDEVRINTADCTGIDQRGVRRPGGVRCDIGAVEMDFDALFVDGFE